MSRTAVLRLLPDGSGRVRIHWFIWDKEGPIQMPQTMVMTAKGPMAVGGNAVTGERRGRIACQPKLKSVLPQQKGQEYLLFTHSDDPRAASCPECMATEEYKAAMKALEEIAQ